MRRTPTACLTANRQVSAPTSMSSADAAIWIQKWSRGSFRAKTSDRLSSSKTSAISCARRYLILGERAKVVIFSTIEGERTSR
jgi:hypothetical protein